MKRVCIAFLIIAISVIGGITLAMAPAIALTVLGYTIVAGVEYVDAPFDSFSEWEQRYITGNEAPPNWTIGEWTNYKANHQRKAYTYIRDLWTQAKNQYDSNWVRQLFDKPELQPAVRGMSLRESSLRRRG